MTHRGRGRCTALPRECLRLRVLVQPCSSAAAGGKAWVFSPAKSIISLSETAGKREGPLCSSKAKRPKIYFTTDYRSSAKEPKKLLCAPETLTSLHVALDFHVVSPFVQS